MGYKEMKKNSTVILNSPDDIQRHHCPVKGFGHGWIIMKKVEPILLKDTK